jgi:hypothetical protein
MNTEALILSLIMCGIGLTLGFVYFNPWGFVLDGVGFLIFLYAIKSGETKNTQIVHENSSSHKRRIAEDRYRCRYCMMFGHLGCKRKEELLNAEPCEDFIESHRD